MKYSLYTDIMLRLLFESLSETKNCQFQGLKSVEEISILQNAVKGYCFAV